MDSIATLHCHTIHSAIILKNFFWTSATPLCGKEGNVQKNISIFPWYIKGRAWWRPASYFLPEACKESESERCHYSLSGQECWFLCKLVFQDDWKNIIDPAVCGMEKIKLHQTYQIHISTSSILHVATDQEMTICHSFFASYKCGNSLNKERSFVLFPTQVR